MFRTALIAAALLGSFAPLTARAGNSIAVSHSDLDLASPAGRATLDARVKAAARKVCTVNGERDPAAQAAATTCLRTALASAETQMASAVASADQRLARADTGAVASGL